MAHEQKTKLIVYADGCALNNGHPNARAGVGVFFGINDERNQPFPVPGKQTNNRAELTAILKALELTEGAIEIVTDSKISVGVLTGTMCARSNLDLVEIIAKLMEGRDVTLTWTKGHTKDKTHPHYLGNKMADLLANQAAVLFGKAPVIEPGQWNVSPVTTISK